MRLSIVVGCIVSLLLLSVALYSEAVDRAVSFDFNTPIEWSQFHSSMSLVEIRHFKFNAHDIVAVMGILAMLAYSIVSRSALPTWTLLIYSVAYLAIGGFLGLIAIAFGGFFSPIDGEFFQDGIANYLGHGFWAYMLVILVIHKLATKIQKYSEQDAP